MLVETYECEEVKDETMEMEDEAVRLINELGLEGQKSLLHVDEAKEGRAVREPYRKMTREEFFVFKNLCSQTVKLNKYTDSPIPTRVLQVAAHATSLGVFKHLEVWYPESADIKDPVLVGVKEPSLYTYEYYPLARWGEVLEEFPVLAKQAMEVWRGKVRAKYEDIVSKCQAKLASLQNTAMSGAIGNLSGPTFYE